LDEKMWIKDIDTKINDDSKRLFADLEGFSKGKLDQIWLDHKTQAIQQCLANNLEIGESGFKGGNFRENGDCSRRPFGFSVFEYYPEMG
jgi:hypothetical protein